MFCGLPAGTGVLSLSVSQQQFCRQWGDTGQVESGSARAGFAGGGSERRKGSLGALSEFSGRESGESTRVKRAGLGRKNDESRMTNDEINSKFCLSPLVQIFGTAILC